MARCQRSKSLQPHICHILADVISQQGCKEMSSNLAKLCTLTQGRTDHNLVVKGKGHGYCDVADKFLIITMSLGETNFTQMSNKMK